MSTVAPSASYSLTVRLAIQNRPGMDSRMTQMAATFALSALGKRIIARTR